MQSNYEAKIAAANRVLGNPGASAADRDAARLEKQIYTTAEMGRVQISTSFERTQATADLALSVVALANAFAQFRQMQVEAAKEQAFYGGRLDIKIGTYQHYQALNGHYCLLANPTIMSLIELQTGKHLKLYGSTILTPGHADKATAAISPGGKWVATVGIDLNETKSSVIIYDLTDMHFK
jgi:hypothetical protein